MHAFSTENVFNCYSTCPHCGQRAPILIGYFTLIDNMVAFIADPSISRAEKNFLVSMARSVAEQTTTPSDAIEALANQNKVSAALFREWLNTGINFVGCMAAVGAFLLTYQDHRGNEPLSEVATSKFEEILRTQPQSNAPSRTAPVYSSRPNARPRFLAPLASERPTGRPSNFQPGTKKSQAQTPQAETKNENRSARRARLAQERKNR
jgi:hypothetical protein